jgi:hypothetical protein
MGTMQTLSIDTLTLEGILEKVDSVITYKELSDAIGKNVQKEARHILASARKRLYCRKPSDRIVFATILKVGLRKLEDIDKPHLVYAAKGRINREATRGILKGHVKDLTKLTPDHKTQHIISMTALELAALSTSEEGEKIIEQNKRGGTKKPTKAMMEALKNL